MSSPQKSPGTRLWQLVPVPQRGGIISRPCQSAMHFTVGNYGSWWHELDSGICQTDRFLLFCSCFFCAHSSGGSCSHSVQLNQIPAFMQESKDFATDTENPSLCHVIPCAPGSVPDPTGSMPQMFPITVKHNSSLLFRTIARKCFVHKTVLYAQKDHSKEDNPSCLLHKHESSGAALGDKIPFHWHFSLCTLKPVAPEDRARVKEKLEKQSLY